MIILGLLVCAYISGLCKSIKTIQLQPIKCSDTLSKNQQKQTAQMLNLSAIFPYLHMEIGIKSKGFVLKIF